LNEKISIKGRGVRPAAVLMAQLIHYWKGVLPVIPPGVNFKLMPSTLRHLFESPSIISKMHEVSVDYE
jgi:hypothetical protein